MSIVRFLLDLVDAEHHQSKLLREVQQDNLRAARELSEVLQEVAKVAGDIRVAMPLIREIHSAVVPESVTKIQLLTETGEHMDIKVGQTSILTAQFLGASGNPTVPVGTPATSLTDSTNFSVADGVVSASGAVGSTTDASVSVDGKTSNTVSYTIVESGPPPNEPVDSIVLTGSEPA